MLFNLSGWGTLHTNNLVRRKSCSLLIVFVCVLRVHVLPDLPPRQALFLLLGDDWFSFACTFTYVLRYVYYCSPAVCCLCTFGWQDDSGQKIPPFITVDKTTQSWLHACLWFCGVFVFDRYAVPNRYRRCVYLGDFGVFREMSSVLVQVSVLAILLSANLLPALPPSLAVSTVVHSGAINAFQGLFSREGRPRTIERARLSNGISWDLWKEITVGVAS